VRLARRAGDVLDQRPVGSAQNRILGAEQR